MIVARTKAAGISSDDGEVAALVWQIERLRKHKLNERREDLALLGKMTLMSLRLDGVEVGEADVVEALLKGGVRGDLRSRRAQLIRNHVAIQLHIERCIGKAVPLKASAFLGWYALLCSGRPAAGIGAFGMARIEQVCRQINSPPMQLQAALVEIATLHCGLLQDPLLPGFNGILARLLLRYHLGRCALPQIMLGADADGFDCIDPHRLYARLVMLLYQRLVQLRRERNH